MSDASAFRPDIEGLRAIAVLLVVLYHAHIGPFDGGLVGVDVFFVLSGFLITSLLLRELAADGRISLADFWARRARRLLPASTITVIATLVAAQWMMSPLEVRSLGHDALAASGFIINIVFMRRNSDYFAAQAGTPSPLLHFWSLAVEEQFYVVWPLALALLGRVRQHLRIICVFVAAVAVGSFVAGIWYTDRSPVSAFYLLPMRAWELAVGALLAVLGTRVRHLPALFLRLVGWAGLAGIVVAALVISDRTPFPGYAALLPVLATTGLVAAGSAPGARGGVDRLLAVRPLQWIGKRSYAIYLWHWPVYILAGTRWGALSAWQGGIAMTVATAIAALSYRLVENPVRNDRWLAQRARRPLLLGAGLVLAAGTLAIVVYRQPIPSGTIEVATPSLTTVAPSTGPLSTIANTTAIEIVETNDSEPSVPTPTTSAAALLAALEAQNRSNLEASVAATALPSNLAPPLWAARNFEGAAFEDGCILPGRETDVDKRPCVYGDPNGTLTVALVGDSHAGHWFPAVDSLAKRKGWRLLVLGKLGCPPENINRFLAEQYRKDCIPWRANVLRRLEAERPDLVLVTHYRFDFRARRVAERRLGEWETALTDYFRSLRPLAGRVVFLEDNPIPPSNIPVCLAKHRNSIDRCTFARAAAVVPEVREAESRAAQAAGATYVPTANWFCTDARCAVVIGNILVFSDASHLTNAVVRYFEPFLDAAITPLLAVAG